MNTKEREVRRVLRLLGNSPRQVAQTLENKGIQGSMQHGSSCPIYRFLTQQGFKVDFVSSDEILLTASPGVDYYIHQVIGGISPSKAIEEFINKFDDGEYPALVEEGGWEPR